MQSPIAFAFLCALSLVAKVSGHGMLLDPPNRSSLWRFDDSAPINYNDNENFCGGAGVHWGENEGNCGVCGDNFAATHPQANENTGLYGTGKIVANYTAGQIVVTSSLLTANHKGFFEFSLCELPDSKQVEPGEDCFRKLYFEDGSERFTIYTGDYEVVNHVKLPEGFKCDHCVFRWTYTAGNNWGVCDDNTQGMGCGPQETFRSCSDIRIE